MIDAVREHEPGAAPAASSARRCASWDRRRCRTWSTPTPRATSATAIRAASRSAGAVDGRVPVPGWTDEYEWTGYIPFDELPHLLQSAAGLHRHGQQPRRGDDYPHFLGREFAMGDRAQRIVELIESSPKVTCGDIRQMHFDQHLAHDAVSPRAPRTACRPTSPELQPPRSTLVRRWDGGLTADSAAAAICEIFCAG